METSANLLEQIRELRATERSLREENSALRAVCEHDQAGQVLLRYQNEAALMHEISAAIVSELDLNTVLTLVANKAMAIVGAKAVLVPMINAARDRYTYLGAVGENAAEIIGTSHRIHVGMCGWVLVHEKPLLFGQPEEWWMDAKTRWEEGMASALLVPLFGKQGSIIGGLSAMGRQGGGSFSDRDMELFTLFANQVSTAIENARLFSELSELAATLEQRVCERTAELASASAEINALNQRLRSENLRMGAELEVTRRLQQMVLPKAHELAAIEHLDIACLMEPASEVGGDYYDVLQHNGCVKIGIGDVTGHGLESGVLMLMVQMAVRTLLTNNVTDPEQFMNVLNRALFDNVKRMDSDKNLTLSLLDYRQGKLCFTGQHEEVLVVRKGGKIERIDTIDLGFMVGLEQDIAHLVAPYTLELQPGDGIVLYTDGITEARNAEKQFYSVERLCQVVSAHWQHPASEILAVVKADITAHMNGTPLIDDITLIILKEK